MTKEEFDALSEIEKIQLYYETLGQDTDEAVWSTAFINGLPDISFAVIAPGGKKDDEGKTVPRTKRHLPHHGEIDKHTSTNVDEPHLKNAAARVNQISDKGVIPKAKSHLRTHYKALKWEIPPNLESEEAKNFEDVTYTKLHIIEDQALTEATDGKYHRVAMLGSIADQMNLNGRLYPKAVWEDNIPRAKELITRGRFVGLNDHPSFFGGGGKPSDIVIKFEDIWFGDVTGPLDDSNELWLEGILIDTAAGLDIAKVAKAEVELGISARGRGSVKTVYKKGDDDKEIPDYDEVQPDYRVEGFDIVYQPAVDDARIYKFEHREDDPMDVEEIKQRYPELINTLSEPLRAKITEMEAEVGRAAEQLAASERERTATKEALAEAQGTIEELNATLAQAEQACLTGGDLIESQAEELESLRPLKSQFEALHHLLEKVRGEPLAWRLVEALKECATPEEIDARFGEARSSTEALLYAEDFLGMRAGKARGGFVPSDADAEDDEYKQYMNQAAERSGLR